VNSLPPYLISASVNPCSPSKANMDPIRTCVLGTGLAGLTFHVPFILALPEFFSLNAVLERNPKTEGGKLQERFGVAVTVYRTLDDVLNDKDLELIVIATPNETHYEFVKKSLEAGKHGKCRLQTYRSIHTSLIPNSTQSLSISLLRPPQIRLKNSESWLNPRT